MAFGTNWNKLSPDDFSKVLAIWVSDKILDYCVVNNLDPKRHWDLVRMFKYYFDIDVRVDAQWHSGGMFCPEE